MSSVSVGEVRRAPVIAMAPLRCIVVSCLITFAEPRSLGPGCSLAGGLHQTSAPYRILGSATRGVECVEGHAHCGIDAHHMTAVALASASTTTSNPKVS